jgi:arabinofuranosyltransferase
LIDRAGVLQTAVSRPRWRLVALAAVALGMLGYWRWQASPVAFDDAFVSFRYARNLLAGHGLVFNPGERVEGYSNFLWTLIAVGGMTLGWDPLATTRGVGVAAYLGTIVLGVFAVGGELRRRREVLALAPLAMLVLPLTYPAFAGSGLETPFVGLMVLLTGLGQHLWQSPRGWQRWLAGLPPLLAVLARLDAGVAVAASLLTIGVAEWPFRARLRARLLPAMVPTAVGLALHFAWRLHYYGEWLPNTYYAKAAYLVSFDLGVEYLFGFLRSCPAALVLFLLAAYGARAAKPAEGRDFARFAAFAFLAQTIFLAKVGGDFMEYRLLWEYWPVLVVGAAVGGLALLRKNLAVAVLGMATALAMSRTAVVLELQHHMQSVAEMDEIARRTTRVGKVLAATLPPDTIVSTTAAGMAYHVPELRVVDQWGLTDSVLARQPVRQIEVRGHVKPASREYLAARHVNLVFDHPRLVKCSNPRRQNRAQVFFRLGDGDECVRSFYLTQTPELTRLFCGHPEHFVLHQVPCWPHPGPE